MNTIDYVLTTYQPECEDFFKDNIKLIPFLIDKYARQYKNDDDLLQICLIAYWSGIRTYNEEMGVSKATYCSRCIINDIRSYVRDSRTKKRMLSENAVRLDSSAEDKKDELYDIVADPHDEYKRQEDKEWAAYIIGELYERATEKEREFLDCWRRHDFHGTNTAKELGVTPQRTHQYIMQLREKTIKIIKKDLGGY